MDERREVALQATHYARHWMLKCAAQVDRYPSIHKKLMTAMALLDDVATEITGSDPNPKPPPTKPKLEVIRP